MIDFKKIPFNEEVNPNFSAREKRFSIEWLLGASVLVDREQLHRFTVPNFQSVIFDDLKKEMWNTVYGQIQDDLGVMLNNAHKMSAIVGSTLMIETQVSDLLQKLNETNPCVQNNKVKDRAEESSSRENMPRVSARNVAAHSQMMPRSLAKSSISLEGHISTP